VSEHLDDDADITDANAFENLTLSQHDPPSSAFDSEIEPPNGGFSSVPPPKHPSNIPIRPEAGNSEINSTSVIERFPHGQPGSPVVGTTQGTTVYESTQDMLGESVWAPFQSQFDWELAYWAKTRGPTSSAMTDLLAIPGVSSITIHIVA
jgi:hypothetical protein